MKIHWNLEQGTPEWHTAREGKLTASNGTAINAKGAGLVTLVNNIILNEVTTQEKDDISHLPDIARGNNLEPLARIMYNFEKGYEAIEVGFIDGANGVGCSPDGIVPDEDTRLLREDCPNPVIIGGCEIKARNDAKHYALLKGGKNDTGVEHQIHYSMLVTGAIWWDFVSYNPNFKTGKLFIKRYLRDEVKIAKMQLGITTGLRMLDAERKTDAYLKQTT